MPDNYELDLLAKTKINSFFFFPRKLKYITHREKNSWEQKLNEKKKERENENRGSEIDDEQSRERGNRISPRFLFFRVSAGSIDSFL